jgi:2-octaprenyl-6-methoxyphenol hydroxylase
MFDVLIVGGGMVGASLASALGANPLLKVGIIETKAEFLQGEFSADGRASAIALGSSQIWQKIGVWGGMVKRGVTPMHSIHVSDGNYTQKVCLNREDINQSALGYIVENQVTQAALWEFVQGCPNIELICPAKIIDIYRESNQCVSVKVDSENFEQIIKLETKLLVGADGGRSLVRNLAEISTSEKLYAQTCIVVTIKTEFPHHNIAYERFQPSGPFALLPLAHGQDLNRFCIVWTAKSSEAQALLALEDEEFMEALSSRLGTELLANLGKLTLETKTRGSYNPRWMHSQTYIQPRLALIGDAAHTTHPVAGQGMNLGIRDAGAIAEIILTAFAQGEDIGSMNVLKRYQGWRRWDNLAVITITDMTNRLFSNQFWLFQLIRRMGLAIAAFSPFKKILMYFMMGLVGRQPNLVKPTYSIPESGEEVLRT